MKLERSISSVFIATLGLLVGCSAGVDDDAPGAGGTSTFLNSKVSMYSTSTETNSWSLPETFNMTLSTCLSETLYGQNIVGQKFEVTGEDVSTEAVTDARGCLYWDDHITYDFLSPERDITVKRTITGLGDYGGSRDIEIMVNPWNGQLFDTSVKMDSKTTRSSSASNKQIKTLYIDSANIKFLDETHNKNTASVTAQISFSPKYTRITKTGEIAPFASLASGELKVTAIIFEEKMDGQIEAISKPSTVMTKIIDNRVIAEFPITIFKAPHQDRNNLLKLGLRLQPNRDTAPKSLTDLEGTVTIRSDFQSDGGSFMIKELPEVAFEKALNRKMDPNKASEFGFSLEDLGVSFAGYTDAHNGTASNKTIKTNYNVCFRNKLTKASVGELRFNVKVIDENGKVISEKENRTKMNGCIRASFERPFELNLERTSNYIKHEMVVEGMEGLFQGFTQRKVFYLNPWEIGGLYSHTIDGEEPPKNPSMDSTKLYVGSFDLNYKRNDETKYRVNENLDMSFVKIYRASFRPQVDRGHMLGGEHHLDSILSGKVRVKVAIVAPKAGNYSDMKDLPVLADSGVTLDNDFDSRYTFITGGEVVAPIEPTGDVMADIPLKFETSSMKFMSTRSYAVVEVSLGAQSKVRPMIFAVPVYLSNTSNHGHVKAQNMIQVKDMNKETELSKLFAKVKAIDYEKPTSNWKVKGIDLFDKLVDAKDYKTFMGFDKATYTIKAQVGFYNTPVEYSYQLITEEALQKLLVAEKHSLNKDHQIDKPWQFMKQGDKDVRSMKARLCSYFYPNPKQIGIYGAIDEARLCTQSPDRYLSIKAMKFVERIAKQPTASSGSTSRGMSLGTGTSASSGSSWGESWGWRANWGFNISTFAVDLIGLGSSGGFGVNYGQSWGNSRGQGKNVSFGESKGMNLDQIKLTFDAYTRRCVIAKNLTGEQKAIKICDEQPKLEEITESWYVLNTPLNSSNQFGEDANDNSLRIFKLLRGETALNKFKNIVEKSNNQMYITTLESKTGVEKYLNGLYISNQGEQPHLDDLNFPGMLE